MRPLSMNYILLFFFGVASACGQPTSRVELHTLFSPSLGITKNFTIYLPAGYDSSESRYPVVYFFRGHEREWFNNSEDASRGGKSLRHVADTLRSQGLIGDMILVGPGTASSDNSVPGLGVNMLSPGLTGATGIGTGKFEDYVTQDLIHHIDSAYRTHADRSGRGIDGFSLGGYTSVMLGLKHPELFSSVGCYDGTHMWYNLDDPRNSGTPPDDNTWMTTSMFNPAFGLPRNVSYMNTYNAANIVVEADTPAMEAIRSVRFFIHTAAFDGNQGNLDRGNHIVNTLLGRNIRNGFSDIRLTPTAIHNWYHADLHARASLVKHWETFRSATGVTEDRHPPSSGAMLIRNFPNPFNSGTVVRFAMERRAHVQVQIRDILGRFVTLLADREFGPGTHDVTFDGADLGSGIYYSFLITPERTVAGKMLLMK
jgi:S-formylglutathione hydrolase FrmB